MFEDFGSHDVPSKDSTHHRYFAGIRVAYRANILAFGLATLLGGSLIVLSILKPGGGTFLPGILCLLAGLGCIVAIFINLTRYTRRVEVSPDGLQWDGGQGSGNCRWKDIVEIYETNLIVNQLYRTKKFRLVLESGAEVYFDQTLSHYHQLLHAVQDGVFHNLYKRKRAQLERGESTFGRVTLHRDGVTVSGRKFNWNDDAEYTIANVILVVYRGSSRKNVQCEEVALCDVPNHRILLALMEELGAPAVSPRESILFKHRR